MFGQRRYNVVNQVRRQGYFHESNFNYNTQLHKPKMFNELRKSSFHTEHWCETCDRSFPTVDLLEKHVQQHQKCNIDGCQFVAHPKVVTKHIQMQHASGLYKKISNLNNPEDIQKWREERKRKYPTKHNIEKKAAEFKEKVERGEKMGLKPNKNNRKFNSDAKRRPGFNEDNIQKRQRLNSKNTTNKKQVKKIILPKKMENNLPSVNNLRTLRPFAGIQEIIMECTAEEIDEEINPNLDIEDEDYINNLQEEPKKAAPIVCSALSALMCDYDSPEEEIDEVQIIKHTIPAEPEFNKNTMTVQYTTTKSSNQDNNEIEFNKSPCNAILPVTETQTNHTNINSQESCDEDGPDEVKVHKTIDLKLNDNEKTTSIHNNKAAKKTHTNNVSLKRYNHKKPKLPSTLLQKLLYREVQQERNIVLQCIRYITKNNFFDKKNYNN